MWATFLPNAGSVAANRAITAKAVIKTEAAAEPEFGKNVAHIRTFGKSSHVDTFLIVLESSHVL